MKSISASKDGQIESDKAILNKLQKIDSLILPEHMTSFHLIDAETLVLIVAKAVECISGIEIQVAGILSVSNEFIDFNHLVSYFFYELSVLRELATEHCIET
jgi:hypothetical protein